jgi:hypothetical protein
MYTATTIRVVVRFQLLMFLQLDAERLPACGSAAFLAILCSSEAFRCLCYWSLLWEVGYSCFKISSRVMDEVVGSDGHVVRRISALFFGVKWLVSIPCTLHREAASYALQ